MQEVGGGSLAVAPALSIVRVLRPQPLRATLLAVSNGTIASPHALMLTRLAALVGVQAVVGPLRPLYVLLCEDNVFRLLPGHPTQAPGPRL